MDIAMEELINRLKSEIITSLNLQDFQPEDIDTDAPLFGDGLGLDSIDSLELMVLLERNYGIKVNGTVFDNMNANGIDYNTWRNALDSRSPKNTICFH